jgi:phage repressor protein C with HTH and peptisase S24 domain
MSAKSPSQTKAKFPMGPRIAALRTERGITQAELANAVGMKQQGIQSLEAGKVKRGTRLREIAEALRTTEAYLLRGPGHGAKDIDPPDQGEQFDVAERPKSGILEIDVRAGLGGGGTTDGREVRHDGDYADPVKPESWKFPSRFMREEIRATESQVIILETDGDSMEPTIGSGERIIVHTGMKTPSPDGIFALRDTFGNIVAKRLQVLRKGDPPRVLIISDNKSHPTEEVGLDEINIVGRVLWGLKRL